MLYDATAIFRPDETLTLTGTFSTTFEQPGTTTGATAKLTYAAIGEAAYQVNPWLTLRGQRPVERGALPGHRYRRLQVGLRDGADYLLNEHTTLTADYSFLRTTTTPEPAADEHRVTVGVTFHKRSRG